MIKVKQIYDFLDKIAPFNLALSFDNCGLLVGDYNQEVTGCVLALDATNEIIDEAVNMNCNLIITHHPIIFNPLKSVLSDSVVYTAIKKGISIISAHTNLDIASGGVNDALAKTLCLENVACLADDGIGRIGDLPEDMNCVELCAYVKSKLSLKTIKCVKSDKIMRRVAVVGGSGASYLENAKVNGADAIITGEAKHNIYLDAQNMELAYLECGHYETECVVLELLKSYLINEFCSVNFTVSKIESSPVIIL